MPCICSGDATSEMPLREWSIELHLLGSHGEDVPADCFEKVTYKLHETFGQRATQSISARSDSIPASAFHYLSNEIVKLTYILRTAFKTPPFRIQEEGWGEFDMVLVLNPKDKGAEITVGHDLNFQNEHYETKHPIVGPSLPASELKSKLTQYYLCRSSRIQSPPFLLS